MAAFRWALAVFLTSLLAATQAGERCGYEYCEHGCCDYDESECCTSTVGLIIGLCVAAGVTIFVIIIIICVCRRRRYRGIVYRNPPAGTVIVQQGVHTTQNGVVVTGAMQPGVVYPPYQPYAPQPGVMAPPDYTGQPYPPPAFAQGPPSYDSLNFMDQGGHSNQGYTEPEKNH
ncbi:hypothetical protein PoB_006927200 [Plakobranchus ocellatus]|uniref:Uncharacterized protein n=1 Tax=Plakobranchus ocellatus TaxID=259542 RepID=A0AAV4DEV6_9GAST|nr:hypothetical protein PoB_006927200 [Plakobranchus ocellatus]